MRCLLPFLSLILCSRVSFAVFCEYCETNVVPDASPTQISDQLDSWDSSVQDLYTDLSDLNIEMDLLYQDLSDLDALFDAGLAAAMSSAGYGARYNNMYSLLLDCFDQYDRITDQYNWLGTHVGDLEVSLQDARRNIHYVTVSTNCTAQSHVGGGDGCGCECHCQDYSADIADILDLLSRIEGNTWDIDMVITDLLGWLQDVVGDVRLSDFLPLHQAYNAMTNAPFGAVTDPTNFSRAELDDMNLWQRLNLFLYRQLDPGDGTGQPSGDSMLNDHMENLTTITNSVGDLSTQTTNTFSSVVPLLDSVFNSLGAGTANETSQWRPNIEAKCPNRLVIWNGLELLGNHIPGIALDISDVSSVRGGSRVGGSYIEWGSEYLSDTIQYARKVSIAIWFCMIVFPVISLVLTNLVSIVKLVSYVLGVIHFVFK